MDRFCKKIKVFFSAVFAVLLAASGLVPASAEESKPRVYRGTFQYSAMSGKISDDFYYSDGYFAGSATKSNAHLRTMSAVLAFSTVAYDDEAVFAQGVKELFTDIGFDAGQMDFQDMDITGSDTIGSVIAHKDIDGVSLIAVVIRGNNYDGEWTNNFLAGKSGDPEGFSGAAAKVLSRLDSYRDSHGITKAKYWVTGYSRAGAVANLIGKTLNEDRDKYGADADGIFVYTFEAPNCSSDDVHFDNIHNVVDDSDLVPYLYPTAWGLGLNGVTEQIGGSGVTVKAQYFDMFSSGFTGDHGEVDQAEFLREFFEFAGENISRDRYADDLQQPVMNVSEVFFQKTPEERSQLSEYMTTVTEEANSDIGMVLVSLPVWMMPESDFAADSLTNHYYKHLDSVRERTDVPLTDDEYQLLKDSLKPLVRCYLHLLSSDKSYTRQDSDGKTEKLPLFRLFTFANHMEEFVSPHYCENILEKLKARDDYYSSRFTVPMGEVFCGGRYTFEEYGDQLAQKAAELGFSENDIVSLKNGYNISVESKIMPLTEDDIPDAIKNADNVAAQYRCYSISPIKQIGFRTQPADAPFSGNTATVVVENEDNRDRDYTVYIGEGAEKTEVTVNRQDGADVLTISAPTADVYVVAFNESGRGSTIDELSGTAAPIIITVAAVIVPAAAFLIIYKKRTAKH